MSNKYDASISKSILALMDDIASPWALTANPDTSDYENLNSPDIHFLDLLFSDIELTFFMDNLKLKSCPGKDNIDYKIISQFSAPIKRFLLALFNKIFTTRSFPSDWNDYTIFFIPKNERDKFRPISLAPYLCKIFERIINNRLSWWLENKNLLPNCQYGFRRNWSCLDNFALLHSDIIFAQDNKENTAALFLDIHAAYDNVLCDILINKLLSLGIAGNTLSYINLTSFRRVQFTFDNIDEIRHVFRDLP